jgi:hypothetical protein
MNRELDVLEAAAAERRGVTRSDTLEPHGLAPEAVAGIARVLARDGRVARAYAARKHVEQLAGEPMYIVAIERATTWWRPERRDRDGQLVRELVDQFELPGEVLAVALAGPTRWLRRRMTKLGGALVYAR